MFLTRRVEFSASHICANPELSEAENSRIYGAEANSHGHGHNFILEVTLAGDPDPVTGMVVDLKELKAILNDAVVDRYDHRFLNHEVEPFGEVVPTLENMTQEIWRLLAARLEGSPGRLHAVRLYETPDLYVDYFGETACSA